MSLCLQIPRLYAVYKEQGIIETFEQMLDNIFSPLFEVTRDPNTHPQLHLFLKQARLLFRLCSLPSNRTQRRWSTDQSQPERHNPHSMSTRVGVQSCCKTHITA